MADAPDRLPEKPKGAAGFGVFIRSLPLLPASVPALLLLDLRDGDLPEKLEAIVARDPVLAGQVIRVANSSAYRGREEVRVLGAAIHRIGAPMIVGTALQRAMQATFDAYGPGGSRLARIALLEANLMRALASSLMPRSEVSPEEAYAQGLLHDIGRLVMAITLGEKYEEFDRLGVPFEHAANKEVETFGFDHQQVGRLLAHHWELPEAFTVVIASHHYPRELREGALPSTNYVIDLLVIADRISDILERCPHDRPAAMATIESWLKTAESTSLLQVVGAWPERILAAIPLAIAGVEHDRDIGRS